jgi:hypothetical protein
MSVKVRCQVVRKTAKAVLIFQAQAHRRVAAWIPRSECTLREGFILASDWIARKHDLNFL